MYIDDTWRENAFHNLLAIREERSEASKPECEAGPGVPAQNRESGMGRRNLRMEVTTRDSTVSSSTELKKELRVKYKRRRHTKAHESRAPAHCPKATLLWGGLEVSTQSAGFSHVTLSKNG